MQEKRFQLLRRRSPKEQRPQTEPVSEIVEKIQSEGLGLEYDPTYTLWYSTKSILKIGFQSIATFIGFMYAISLTTWIPDLDQWLMPLLHHRSIITHSILLPLLIMLFIRPQYRHFVAFLYAAVGIHLSADILSPSIGYGAIWLPEPFKMSIGIFSKPWIALNTTVALIIAFKLASAKYFHHIALAMLLSALSYAVNNEGEIVAFLAFIVFFSPLWLYFRSKFKAQGHDHLRLVDIISKYQEASKIRTNTKKKHIKTLGKLWYFKIFAELLWVMLRNTLMIPVHIYKNPQRGFALLLLVAIPLGGVYFMGVSGGTSGVAAITAGATKIAAEGVWVLHSSGGYILKEGGRYVAGTLRETMP